MSVRTLCNALFPFMHMSSYDPDPVQYIPDEDPALKDPSDEMSSVCSPALPVTLR